MVSAVAPQTPLVAPFLNLTVGILHGSIYQILQQTPHSPNQQDGCCLDNLSKEDVPASFIILSTRGVCGATDNTIVARNLLRETVGGASSHAEHAFEIAETLKLVYTREYSNIMAKTKDTRAVSTVPNLMK